MPSKECPWPTCGKQIHHDSAFCYSHARLVTYALNPFPEDIQKRIRALLDLGGPHTEATLCTIRALEYSSGKDYLNKEWRRDVQAVEPEQEGCHI